MRRHQCTDSHDNTASGLDWMQRDEGKSAEGLRVCESKNEGIKRSGGRSQRRRTDGGLSAAGCDCARVLKSDRGLCVRAAFGESLPLLL